MKLTRHQFQTVRSSEIAELVGSRHDSVKRAIDRLVDRGVIDQPPMVDGKKSANHVVSKEYEITKRDTYVIVAQLSPEFTAALVDRWAYLEQKEAERIEAEKSRQTARLEAPMMTDAIKHQRESAGKPISHYHFSNEFDLINRIALGQTSKQFRTEHGIGKDGAIRDYLTAGQIKCIEHLQRVNTSLMDIGMTYDERKAKLNQVYMLHHCRKLMAEVIKLEG